MAYSRREGYFRSFDRSQIFFQTWDHPDPKAVILISHGQGEHSECYHRLIHGLRNESLSFRALDYRGHGRSDGKRGYAANIQEYLHDYEIFLRAQLEELEKKSHPVFLLGHSMGAMIQLRVLIENPDIRARGVICSAPLLGLAVKVPAFKEHGAKILNQLLPTITMWNELDNSMLTRDPEVLKEFDDDALRHNRISPGVYLGFLETFDFLQARAREFIHPILFQCPEDDPVVSTPATKDFYEKCGSWDKTLKLYGGGARHEMYNDIHRAEVFADLAEWLRQHLEDAK
ncbi:MAG: lysophospholipase [Bdellovibrionaceae bacterium]|nr:lysophospholipase [Pseudobdellovibrionaceae bacterium]